MTSRPITGRVAGCLSAAPPAAGFPVTAHTTSHQRPFDNGMHQQLPWLAIGEKFPPPDTAWGPRDPAPGLLAAGGALDPQTLINAYSNGTFPWFSKGQPILWWNPNPRMVLRTAAFRVHRSMQKKLKLFLGNPRFRLRIDTDFEQVITACATKSRDGQAGTWIVPAMVDAYLALHVAGLAHSVETWLDDKLIGGLYCVNLGSMVFGESMFSHQTDASKIALAGLVAFCRAKDIEIIDCQQNTGHMASLGAREISRTAFLDHLMDSVPKPQPDWNFDPRFWKELFPSRTELTLP